MRMLWLTLNNYFLDLRFEGFLDGAATLFRLRFLAGWMVSSSSSVRGLSSSRMAGTDPGACWRSLELTGGSGGGERAGKTVSSCELTGGSGGGEHAGKTVFLCELTGGSDGGLTGPWATWESGRGDLLGVGDWRCNSCCLSSAENCVDVVSEDPEARAACAASCRSMAIMSSSSEHSTFAEWLSLAPFSLPNNFLDLC